MQSVVFEIMDVMIICTEVLAASLRSYFLYKVA